MKEWLIQMWWADMIIIIHLGEMGSHLQTIMKACETQNGKKRQTNIKQTSLICS